MKEEAEKAILRPKTTDTHFLISPPPSLKASPNPVARMAITPPACATGPVQLFRILLSGLSHGRLAPLAKAGWEVHATIRVTRRYSSLAFISYLLRMKYWGE